MQLGDRLARVEERVAAIEDLLAALSLTVADLGEAAGIPQPPVIEPESELEASPTIVPAAEAAPTRVPPVPPRGYYVITRAPAAHQGLLGLHYSTWPEVAARLPGGRLCGSGCELKRVASEDAAVERWTSRGWQLPLPRH